MDIPIQIVRKAQQIKPNELSLGEMPVVNIVKQKATPKEAILTLTGLKSENVHYVKVLDYRNGHLLASNLHPFLSAVHFCHVNRQCLVLSPDLMWYLIASGAGLYAINQKSSTTKLEDVLKFLTTEKKSIRIQRDKYILGATNNSWYDIFDDFSNKLRSNVKDKATKKMLCADFTTTIDYSEYFAFPALMDEAKHDAKEMKSLYLDQKTASILSPEKGIPEFRITGVKSDWENVRKKADELVKTVPELRKWFENGVDEILENILDVFGNKIDQHFWNQIYKLNDGVAGSLIGGWALALFPYLSDGQENKYVWKERDGWRSTLSDGISVGLGVSSFSYSMNQVPFVLKVLDHEANLLFASGLIGIVCNKEKLVRPIFGYTIADHSLSQDKKA